MKKNWPLIVVFFLLGLFFYPIWLKGKIIGPFDFLVNWYHPYKTLDWSYSNKLYTAFLQFKTYLMSDVVAVVFPLKHFTIESLKQGIIPLWNPYYLSGAPHLANTQGGVFNPFNLWFIFFGYLKGFNLFIVSQTFLAALFMYLFLRSIKFEVFYCVLGSLTFALSGYFIVWLPWGTLGYAYLYLPLTLYLLNRSKQGQSPFFFAASAFALAISFYSGHIQTSVAISLAVYFFLFFQHFAFKKILVHLLLVFCFSAPQLLPTTKLLQFSARQAVTTENFYQQQTGSLFQLLNNFAPDYFGNPVTRNWWGKNNYAETISFCGSLFFILLFINLLYLITQKKIVSKNRIWIFFNLLLLFSFVLSVKNPISYLIFKSKLPLLSSSTFSRYLLLFSFSEIVIGLYTLKELLKESSTNLVPTTALTVIWTVGIWLFTLFFLPKITVLKNLTVAERNLFLPSGIAIGFLSLLWLKAYFSSRLPNQVLKKQLFLGFSVLIIVLQLVDLFRFGHKYLPFSPKEFFFPETPLTKYAAKKLTDARFYGNFDGNFNMLYNLKAATGADPLYNFNYAQLLFSSKTGKPEINDRASVHLQDGPYVFKILNILGVRYLIDEYYYQRLYDQYRPKNSMNFTNTFPKIKKIGIYNIYLNPFAAKMAYFIPETNLRILPEGEKTIAYLLKTGFNPQQSAVINQKPEYQKIKSLPVPKKTEVKIIKTEPQKWQLLVKNTKPGLLIINQSFSPNWKAKINSQKAPIIKVNHTLQAIALEPGVYQVVLEYQDQEFILGMILFFVALFFSGWSILNT